MGEDIGIQRMNLTQPAGSRGMVQQTNTYVMSRVYLLCSGGKAIKITFKERNLRDIILKVEKQRKKAFFPHSDSGTGFMGNIRIQCHSQDGLTMDRFSSYK